MEDCEFDLLGGRGFYLDQLLRDGEKVWLENKGGGVKGKYALVWRPPLVGEQLQPQQQLLLVRRPSALAALLGWHLDDTREPLLLHAQQLGTGVEDLVIGCNPGSLACRLIAHYGACKLAVHDSYSEFMDKASRKALGKWYPEANYPDRNAGAVVDLLELWNKREYGEYRSCKVVQVGRNAVNVTVTPQCGVALVGCITITTTPRFSCKMLLAGCACCCCCTVTVTNTGPSGAGFTITPVLPLLT
jgi:hypothetical protein